MLLLLLTGQRGQSSHLFKVEDVIFHSDSVELQCSVVLKHTRPGRHQDKFRFQSYIQNKVRKTASIRNRYNQVPHLSEDTKLESNKITKSIANRSQEVSSFPLCIVSLLRKYLDRTSSLRGH